jgi:5'-3' exonuclease
MGIVYFYKWYKENFEDELYPIQKNEKFSKHNINVDSLMIDMNGIFHNSAQKIFQYGNHKPPKRLLGKQPPRPSSNNSIRVYSHICSEVDRLLKMVNPRVELILCVDGPAPLSKQNQQRKRRYKSVKDKDENDKSFDPNCMTPGTKFMDHLSKYIDWYIKKKISEDPQWGSIKVVFSNEKNAGEGEQKAFEYVRNHGNPDYTYCIHGNDADIIMLSMVSKLPNMYVLRDDPYDYVNDYYIINIGSASKALIERMDWGEADKKFKFNDAINDFIFMCFMVGNDFIPNIPSLNIIGGGIEFLLDTYKNTGKYYGHLTRLFKGDVMIVKKSMKIFLGNIGKHEKEMLEEKLSSNIKYFEDKILDKHTKYVNGYVVDMKNYKTDYYSEKFDKNVQDICHDYIEGMQWVLSYYTKGVPCWHWFYDHHYAPFAYDLATHIDSYKPVKYEETRSIKPFEQLLSVIPPKSSQLLPKPLNTLLTSQDSPIEQFCPSEIKVDLSGKRREWEGVVLLPMVDRKLVEKVCGEKLKDVSPKDIKRNNLGRSFVYVKIKDASKYYTFESFYGNIDACKASSKLFDI